MGYMFATGSCLACGNLFTFNPEKVPSKDGEPICKQCMDLINELRAERGEDPFLVPPDAYEPVECL